MDLRSRGSRMDALEETLTALRAGMMGAKEAEAAAYVIEAAGRMEEDVKLPPVYVSTNPGFGKVY